MMYAHCRWLSVMLLIACCVGCNVRRKWERAPTVYATTAQAKYRWAAISHWERGKDGWPTNTKLYLRDEALTSNSKVESGDYKFLYMQIGKKAILPQFFTLGKDAQATPAKDLEQAWRDRKPGVYKFDYSDPAVRDKIFKGFKVEISN